MADAAIEADSSVIQAYALSSKVKKRKKDEGEGKGGFFFKKKKTHTHTQTIIHVYFIVYFIVPRLHATIKISLQLKRFQNALNTSTRGLTTLAAMEKRYPLKCFSKVRQSLLSVKGAACLRVKSADEAEAAYKALADLTGRGVEALVGECSNYQEKLEGVQ